jgi:hypothetical protein
MDGRIDLFSMHGWYEQPANLGSAEWVFHAAPFTSRPYAGENQGGAHMYAYDIDGDGDNDVVTAIQAHAWGLHWLENLDGKGGDWEEHMIMGTAAEKGQYGGVAVSHLHNLNLADINGDGLLDLVAGKRWGTHGPNQNDPREIFWWELKRDATGASFIPHLIDNYAGAGCQVKVGDLNGDGKLDVVTGGRRGTYALINNTPNVGVRNAALLQSKNGISILSQQRSSAGPVLKLRFLQAGFENSLSLFDAVGKEKTFPLGSRKAGEVFSLDLGNLQSGTYLLRATRDGATQNLGALPLSR